MVGGQYQLSLVASQGRGEVESDLKDIVKEIRLRSLEKHHSYIGLKMQNIGTNVAN